MHVVSASVLEDWHGLSDEEVITRVRNGQTALFEVLMRRHNERLFRTARAILRDDNAAGEAIERAYLNAYARLRQFTQSGPAAIWLTQLVVREALADIERRKLDTFADVPSIPEDAP